MKQKMLFMEIARALGLTIGKNRELYEKLAAIINDQPDLKGFKFKLKGFVSQTQKSFGATIIKNGKEKPLQLYEFDKFIEIETSEGEKLVFHFKTGYRIKTNQQGEFMSPNWSAFDVLTDDEANTIWGGCLEELKRQRK